MVRAECDPSLGEVLASVLQQLEPVRRDERMRWRDLVWFVLSWVLQRRPEEEAGQLIEGVKAALAGSPLQEEVERMTEATGQTLTEWAEARGEARGRAIAELATRREDLVLLLEKRLGHVPETVRQRIEAVDDPERLRAAMLEVFDLQSPAGLKL